MDYKKLGFKCGIEIHQQLSGKKLFCDCSTDMTEEKEIKRITRKIRPVAGEQGGIDIAAAFEESRKRTFVYHGYKNESCLVELDEEPPHKINLEAIEMALSLGKLLKLKIPDAIYVMRKGVFDGSATSGFQRTALVGLQTKNSYLETSKGKVGIEQLNLEEDACKKIKQEGNTVHYSLSRLGVPLVEIGTAPDIKDPEHALETAKLIGMILRSFPLTKRGIGTIRQDVNVSIKGGARVEVKGWQDLKTFTKLIENEVLRQKFLIKLKKDLKKNNFKTIPEPKDVTKLFKKTKFQILQKVLKNNGSIYGLKIPKFNGLLKQNVCENKTFGKELAEYAMAFGTKGMIHSDEDLSKYELEKDFEILRKELKATKNDLVLIVAESRDIAERAINAVRDRVLYCLKGVPEETRVPNHVTATSSYARPLPGSSRMYPETDVEMILVTKKVLKELKKPELLAEKAIKLEKTYALPTQTAQVLVNEDKVDEFEYLIKEVNLEPKFTASIITTYPKEIKTRFGINTDNLKEKDFLNVLKHYKKGEVAKEAILEMLKDLAQGKKLNLSKFKSIDEKEVEKKLKEIIEKNKGAPFNALMGEAMKEFRGKIDGKLIMEKLKKMV